MSEVSLEHLPSVLTVEQAARELRIGKNRAYEWAKSGRLPSIRSGRRFLIPRLGVEKMLAKAAETAE
jgi:excisionase family DNA binding protein